MGWVATTLLSSTVCLRLLTPGSPVTSSYHHSLSELTWRPTNRTLCTVISFSAGQVRVLGGEGSWSSAALTLRRVGAAHPSCAPRPQLYLYFCVLSLQNPSPDCLRFRPRNKWSFLVPGPVCFHTLPRAVGVEDCCSGSSRLGPGWFPRSTSPSPRSGHGAHRAVALPSIKLPEPRCLGTIQAPEAWVSGPLPST